MVHYLNIFLLIFFDTDMWKSTYWPAYPEEKQYCSYLKVQVQ